MISTNDIRQVFLDYFSRNGHQIVSSSPLVPHKDPSLLFTNAGMVQFKNVFTGVEKRDYTRAVTTQKCVRAGGKHNDLDNVGYTARHHTFFEMLGNFSFGDYFKEPAIELAWNLVTKELGLSSKKLMVTVYAEDDHAFNLWKKIGGLTDDRIIRIGTSDNFWSMGATGPCGPCSEIFFDHGDHLEGGPPGSPNEDGDRFVEIWNLVFMQFEQISDTERIELPKPSIDTGMGLERIAAVLQGTHDNFETDSLRSLRLASAEISGQSLDGAHGIAHRIIADHMRACGFLIGDGVLPSNDGRGYVLRRIMRRAMRHAHMMGCSEPLLWQLVPKLVEQMGSAFPELRRAEPLIAETLRLEENKFKETLERGLHLLDEAVNNLGESQSLPGDVAFRLYDTYGFPLDLTEDVLRNRGIGVDIPGFNLAMDRQQEQARKKWTGSGETIMDSIWFDIRGRVGPTHFVGYDAESAEASVQAIIQNGREVNNVAAGSSAIFVLNNTPMYGESGGQLGDTGQLITASGGVVIVNDTQKYFDEIYGHFGSISGSSISVGDKVEVQVDHLRRVKLRVNHTATHLLHAALRRVLGDHVAQKGSLVTPDRLRFDFAHTGSISSYDLRRVEVDVNSNIRVNTRIETRLMHPEEAEKSGALALFGEKYGDEVRVVFIEGEGVESVSVELCGGIHAERIGDIGFFKIVAEGAVGSNVRRIEAVTAEAAEEYVDAEGKILREVSAELKSTPSEVLKRVQNLVEERKKLERELERLRSKMMLSGGAESESEEVNGVRYVGRRVDGVSPNDLKKMIDVLKRSGEGIYAMVAVREGKASLVVGVTNKLLSSNNAVELVKRGSAVLGGKGGGGRPDMAQAGGPHGEKAEEALMAIKMAINPNN